MNAPKPQINTLEAHMLPSQKANLVQILEIGEKRKEEGERMKEKWWEGSNNWDEFSRRWAGYNDLTKLRLKEHNNELLSIWYFAWNEVTRSKFLEQYAMYMVICNEKYETPPIPKEIPYLSTSLDYIKKHNLTPPIISSPNILLDDEDIRVLCDALISSWWLYKWTILDLGNASSFVGGKYIADMLLQTWGMKEWSRLSIEWNSMGDEWITAIVDAIKETGWLPIGAILNLGFTSMGIEWVKACANMITTTWWIREWVSVRLGNNTLWDKWALLIANALEATGGLSKWANILLNHCGIWDEWLIGLIKVINKTGWMRNRTRIDLSENSYSFQWIENLLNEIEMSWKLYHWSSILLTKRYNTMSPETLERVQAFNRRMPGEVFVNIVN